MVYLTEYKKYLNDLGYFEDEESYDLSEVLESILFRHKITEKVIILYLDPDDYFKCELEHLKDDEPFQNNLDRYKVIGALIEAPLVNEYNEFDSYNDYHGIILLAEEHRVPYSKASLDLFEKCVWIQNNILEHEEFILKCHIKHLKIIRREYQSILHKFQFYHEFSTTFNYEDSSYESSDSDPVVVFFNSYGYHLTFRTNCITGELYCHDELILDKDFEKYLEDTFTIHPRTKDIRMEFRYLYEDDWYPDSAKIIQEISSCDYGVRNGLMSKEVALKEIEKYNLTHIPKEKRDLLEVVNSWKS